MRTAGGLNASGVHGTYSALAAPAATAMLSVIDLATSLKSEVSHTRRVITHSGAMRGCASAVAVAVFRLPGVATSLLAFAGVQSSTRTSSDASASRLKRVEYLRVDTVRVQRESSSQQPTYTGDLRATMEGGKPSRRRRLLDKSYTSKAPTISQHSSATRLA